MRVLILTALLFITSMAQTAKDLEKVDESKAVVPVRPIEFANPENIATPPFKEFSVGDFDVEVPLAWKRPKWIDELKTKYNGWKDEWSQAVAAGKDKMEKLKQKVKDKAKKMWDGSIVKMKELATKLKEYIKEYGTKALKDVWDFLKSVGQNLVDMKTGLKAFYDQVAAVRSGKKKFADGAKEMAKEAANGLFKKLQSFFTGLFGVTQRDKLVKVVGIGYTADIGLVVGVTCGGNIFFQWGLEGGKLAAAIAPTCGVSLVAGAGAAVGPAITVSWNTAPKDVAGFGLALDVAIADVAGIKVTLGWAWDTDNGKFYLAGISFQIVGGVEAKVAVGVSWTSILIDGEILIAKKIDVSKDAPKKTAGTFAQQIEDARKSDNAGLGDKATKAIGGGGASRAEAEVNEPQVEQAALTPAETKVQAPVESKDYAKVLLYWINPTVLESFLGFFLLLGLVLYSQHAVKKDESAYLLVHDDFDAI